MGFDCAFSHILVLIVLIPKSTIKIVDLYNIRPFNLVVIYYNSQSIPVSLS